MALENRVYLMSSGYITIGYNEEKSDETQLLGTRSWTMVHQ
jgi:hypothetical protein